MRLFWTAVGLAILTAIPFLFWGDVFTQWFTGASAIAWIEEWGAWGWLAVMGLLISDLILPIPATPVMSAAGYLYGTIIGGLISAAGSFCSGMAGYGLCRIFGRKVALRLAGEQKIADHQSVFERNGLWLVVASRWLPILPEVVSCLAGLTGMRLKSFSVALACGSLPMGFAYAAIGAAGREIPVLALGLSLLLPPLLWVIVRPLLR